VLERLGPAQGLRQAAAPQDLVETPSGDLWLSGVDGQTFHIPAAVRTVDAEPPDVFVAALTTERGPHDASVPLTVPYENNALELRFSAPSFGRGGPVRYRFRLAPDQPWSAPFRDPTLRLAALAPGRYAIEVQASTNGLHWSAEPARVALRVRAPWFLQAWFVGPATGVVVGAVYLIRRHQHRAALRLEVQRARIARDLHDEIGSGLGAIGLLAGFAGRQDGGARSQVSQIEALAAELGTSLTDIVTSLRSGAANLRALHRHVVNRGRRLCSAPTPRFEASPSESIAAVPVSLAVRINVLLIAVEAIHNAVRHARATTVRLDLERAGPRRWILAVMDDGIGMASSQEPSLDGVRGGLGLENIRARAVEIGAEVSWASIPGGGTTMRLRFDPDEGTRWPWVSWRLPLRSHTGTAAPEPSRRVNRV
jgi:signal transduction histidine kinase